MDMNNIENILPRVCIMTRQGDKHGCEQQHFSTLLVAKWTHIHMKNIFPYYDLQSGQTLIFFKMPHTTHM
jgi:hypothetical protein